MRRRIALLLLATAAALAGCKDAPAPAGSAPPSKTGSASAVSLDAIAAQAKGFSVGPAMSARVVYVFFDPQCPHCAALWNNAKPLKAQARFVWIPVSLLNTNSTVQGATLLAASDPVAAMDGHEASLLAKRGGIAPGGDYEQHKPALARNTELFNSFGFSSVPTIVAKHPQTGTVLTREGALPTPELAQLLGLGS